MVGSLRLGGAEARTARVARAIRAYGIDMEVCALERIGANLTALEESGVKVHGTPYENRATDRLDVVALARTVNAIRRLVKTGDFDIVHTALFWADVLGVMGGRLAGCKRVIISRQALHGWTHSPGARFHWLEQFTNLFAHELIADSQTVLTDTLEHERFLPAKRGVIHSGVEVDGYTPATPRLAGPLRMVSVGALAPRKGQEYAIEALSMLREKGIEATLELVGSGPDEAMLREKAAAGGVTDLVVFAGEHTDPRPYLAKADLFVFPSRQEGGAIALLEAMASSLPIVASGVGGVTEAVVDGEGGRLVPPQQPAALAAAIAELARDRSRLAEMGRRNRERAVELFSIDTTARRLADWYLNGPGPRGSLVQDQKLSA